MKSFKLFIAFSTLVCILAIINQAYQLGLFKENEKQENKITPPIKQKQINNVVNQSYNKEDAALITELIYYNYDNGETILYFKPEKDSEKGTMHIVTKEYDASFKYLFDNNTDSFRVKPWGFSQFAKSPDSIKFSYNLYGDQKSIEATLEGHRYSFTTEKRKQEVYVEREYISGEYIVDRSWIMYDNRGVWDGAPFSEEIYIKTNTEGKLYIRGYDFLEEFTLEQAPLSNMDGYNSAEISSGTPIKVFYDNEKRKNYVFEETLFFNGNHNNYSCLIRYTIITDNGEIIAIKLLNNKINRKFLFKLEKVK